jgi:hypothetical protein
MPVEVGDHVVFCASAGVWIEVDEERLLACRVGELLGVIEQAIDQEYTPAGASRLTSSSSRPQPWRAARGAPARDTPLGLHHLQTHYDIPVVVDMRRFDVAWWRGVEISPAVACGIGGGSQRGFSSGKEVRA